MTTRKYSSRSQQTTLTSAITAGALTMVVGSGTSLLGGATVTGTERFTVVIDPDTALEEIVDVSLVSTNTLTIARGIEVSGVGQAHSAGAVVRHMAIGRDYREANLHIEATAAYNDGTATHHLHGIASGEGDVVGTSKAQTLSNKTLGSALAAGTFKITGLGDPTTAQDAATKNYVDTGMSSQVAAAASSATAAATSATSASASATAAATSASSASTSASSALTSQTAAATSATSAATSATSAATSATAAATSASSASTSASSALTSASSALTSQTAAATSASSASTSASSALTSQTAAATSATSASASATAAATSATSASASQTAAATSATSAAASATAAATSATSASASATAAATSATSAAVSAASLSDSNIQISFQVFG